MPVKKQLLIVDDDELLSDMYSVKFNENNFDVVTAFGADEALEKLKNGLYPDVILLDIVMPGSDGLDFLRNLRRNNLASGSKVVILSNQDDKKVVKEAESLGAVSYILKANTVPSEVLEKIKKIIETRPDKRE